MKPLAKVAALHNATNDKEFFMRTLALALAAATLTLPALPSAALAQQRLLSGQDLAAMDRAGCAASVPTAPPA